MQSSPVPVVQSVTFTDWMRIRFKTMLDAAGGFFLRLGIAPNTITLLGLFGSIAGAAILAAGFLPLGGLVILLSGTLDSLDGTMARLGGKVTTFGAFLDSVSDRWSELFLFGALALYFARGNDVTGVVLAFAAAIGSVMVSYEKARAEALGFECKVGLLTRMERYLVLCPTLLLNLPLVGVVIVAVLGNFTALQRIWHVRNQARQGNIHS